MTRLITEEIEAIRKRAEQASECPWEWDGDYLTYRKHGMLEPIIWADRHGDIIVDESDAEFIAAAREDIPKLLAEVARLKSQLSEAESLLSEAHDIMDDVHLYDTELYGDISKYFNGEDDEE